MTSPARSLRDKIENSILTGGFSPGERLDEVQLATRFGVSRTPVREALMQLGAIGLIDIRPRRGAFVATLGPERVFEMFEVMAELEAMAGALAARRSRSDDKLSIKGALNLCRTAAESDDTDQYYYENEVFHRSIYRASHSGFLEEQCVALHRRLRPYRRLQLRVRNRMKASLAEHEAIVDAILAEDAEGARVLLRKHIAVQGDRFGDLLATFSELPGHKLK